MLFLKLALKSLLNRKFTSLLTVISIALSVALLLGVELIRKGARESFTNTISQTDLIVGAKGGSVQLLLYSVFRMGSATNNIGYKTYEHYKNDPRIAWTIPISLGDSYYGFRVVSTDENFYEHYRYQQDKSISFRDGKRPDGIFDVVLGSEVADRLHLKMGGKVALTHGVSEGRGIINHDDKPFTIVGILNKTGTPVDKSLYITLEGMEAIHIDWKDGGAPRKGHETKPEDIKKSDLHVGQITAFLLRAKSRIQTLGLQREINTYEDEPLLAIIPGVTLAELWDSIGYAETALKIVTWFVLLVGLTGMLIALYTSLEARRREMSILRAIGAKPTKIISLLVFESVTLACVGALAGVGLLYGCLSFIRPWIESEFGLYLPVKPLGPTELMYLGLVVACSFIIGFIPAWKAYKNSLVDGLTLRI